MNSQSLACFPALRRGFALMLASILAMVMIGGCLGGSPAHAQNVNVNVRVAVDDLGRASQIIVPQARGFVLEQRGQAVQIERVDARIAIIEQAASTTLNIALRNPGAQQVEAVLLLPVPDGAVVSAFDFHGSASEPTAQVLQRDEARRLYESIVARVRDPALLEFAGYNLIRSSVFPVPAGGTQQVRLTYEHILGGDGPRIDYVLPRSESLEKRSPWRIDVDLQSKRPISTVYSPTHELFTHRLNEGHLRLKLDERDALNPGPFMFSYLTQRQSVTGTIFAYPDPKVSPAGGYFLFIAGLPAEIAGDAKRPPREVTIVIDRSGSMAGPKMEQARAAALQVLEGLEDGEAFNIIDYATTVSSFAPAPVIKGARATAASRQYLAQLKPGGGTNIHDALVEALKPSVSRSGALPMVLFLTDGLPTVGNTSEVAIRQIVEQGNAAGRRIFTFGVGHDVNVPLLDRVADITRAAATYVLPEEDVELKVAQVFRRLNGPVFSDITWKAAAAGSPANPVRELIPSRLPDLFDGDQLIVLGQYRDGGELTCSLTGRYLGAERAFNFTFNLDSASTRNAFVPRLWASRRIAYLVDQIRQAGASLGGQPATIDASLFDDPRFKELSDEILRLSTEFGILTEYTAFLATEGTDLSDWSALSAACGSTLDTRAVKTRWGEAAVNQGMNFNAQKAQSKLNYGNRYVDAELNTVAIANVQQVCDRAFFKRGRQWVDSRLVVQQELESQPQPDSVIDYGSAEHLALLERLVQQNRQGVLSLEGDILIDIDGRTVLIRNQQ